jgi:pyruvate,water dikinase
MSEGKPIDKLIHDLQERAKELNCLYQVQELLNNPQLSLDQVCQGITEAIPPGWQYPELCCARITINKHIQHQTKDFLETPWKQHAGILVSGERIGEIEVFYSANMPEEDEGPFLKEERKLINTISEQLGYYLLNHQLREVFEQQHQMEQDRKAEWRAILNMLRRTDPKLLVRISRKMISYLCSSGIKEAEQYLVYFSPAYHDSTDLFEENRPYILEEERDSLNIIDDVYNLASEHLDEDIMLEEIHQWIKEEQTDFLIQVLVSPGSTLEEISTAIERYHHLAPQGMVLSKHRDRSVRGGLIRRLLNDQPGYIDTCLDYITIEDINQLFQKTIFQIGSHGKLGGKGSGLVLANLILQKMHAAGELQRKIKIPKTWYLVSDCIFKFIDLNGFEDFIDQKYKDLQLVRQEYPFIVHVFKNGTLPPEIIKGLSLALDDFGDVPLIVRSSSLLEDQQGLAFAGKYKSLFIPNKGSKEERLSTLIDAITEVYASMFGPDPIGYRTAHELLEHHEEMAIMIQEVVGSRNGDYFFPSCAGVAFSDIEIPWSSRISRSDGLVRLVPGLGTRAVDRTGDDYPILVAPGQPGLRTNVSLDETVRYSPKYMDVINLKIGTFETVEAISLLTEMGAAYPKARNLLSEISRDRIKPISLPKLNQYDPKDLAVTFDGMFSKTQFLAQVHTILKRLKEVLGYPVDIEFACDGEDFYLLQCRSQSYDQGAEPAPIPNVADKKNILFSSSRFVPNGRLKDISHIVYVDPKGYYNLTEHTDLISVGKAVSRLNEILPRKRFILIGPGRWGSRGEIKLGVRVTYSDICHTAMLVEIAEPHGPYQPDPSFGTHFFQDLVEAQIRYLPLFPDESGEVFNYGLFDKSKNHIEELLPDFQHLANVIKVIDIAEILPSKGLQVYMNAFTKKALAVFQPNEE